MGNFEQLGVCVCVSVLVNDHSLHVLLFFLAQELFKERVEGRGREGERERETLLVLLFRSQKQHVSVVTT